MAIQHKALWAFILITLIILPFGRAQVSPEEHAKHHPSGGAQKTPTNSPQGGGMGAMMKEMMTEMHSPKKKEFYPSLMTLPELSKEARLELETQAHERMKSGAAIMNRSMADLISAAESNDNARMKKASGNIREGLAQFESGIATHEAINQGKSPQEIGLTWFKQNLNIDDSLRKEPFKRSYFGLDIFHLFVMALLSLFALTMIIMYFFKMRRAASLLAKLKSMKVETSSKPWKGKLKVATVYQETPTVKTFKLVEPSGNDLPFTYLAGQFMNLAMVIDGKPIKRAYTIASHPCDRKMLEITIKREENGLVSRYMHDFVHEGDLIDIEAAYGQLTFSGVGAQGIVLIGGGVGITPLMSVLRCLISCGMKNEISLLYACKTLEDFVYREELRLLQSRNSNLKILVAVEKMEGSFPGAYEGRLTKEKIQEAAPGIVSSRVHLCGPPGMMQAVRAILAELKVQQDQIKTEAFGSAIPPTPKVPHVEPADSTSLKQVSFKKSGKTLGIHPDETVLELAETAGIEIPNSCRIGTCGTCKVKLHSGQVTMDVQDSLTEDDKHQKIILACQAKATSDLLIEEP